MPSTDQDPKLLARITADPCNPLLERELRRLRWQMAPQACSRALNAARLRLAAGYEHGAHLLRWRAGAMPGLAQHGTGAQGRIRADTGECASLRRRSGEAWRISGGMARLFWFSRSSQGRLFPRSQRRRTTSCRCRPFS